MSLDEKRAKKKNKTFVELTELIPWTKHALKAKLPRADEIFFRPNPKLNTKICIWLGDITSLCADAIVNPTNGSLMGGPGLSGEIHSRAGPLLREECTEHPILPRKRMIRLETGYAIVTCGYWLPAKYVIHTVGPTVNDTVREIHQNLLSSCYHECLEAMKTHNERYRKIHNFREDELREDKKNERTLQKLGLSKTEVKDPDQPIGIEYSEASQGKVFLKPPIRSIAFPCISTGAYGYPHEQAADVALMTVRKWLDNPHNHQEVEELEMIIFCVLIENDLRIYNELLPQYFPIHDGKLRKTSHVSSPPKPKPKVAAAMEKREALNKATAETVDRHEQHIQQSKTTTFSSSPEAHPKTEQMVSTTPVNDGIYKKEVPHPEIIKGEPSPPEITRLGPPPPEITRREQAPINKTPAHSGHHAEVVILQSSTSPLQQSIPPYPQPVHQQVQQQSYTSQIPPQSHSHYQPKPITQKSPKQDNKKSKQQKKEEQQAKKEAKLLKKQQEKSAKKNKKSKKYHEIEDFAPMDIDFDDELMGPTPVKNVAAPSPIQKAVSPVQQTQAPIKIHLSPPVHASPPVHTPSQGHAPSPGHHAPSSGHHVASPGHHAPTPLYKMQGSSPGHRNERGHPGGHFKGLNGRSPQIDVSINIHKTPLDSNDADVDDYDDEEDDDMPPPPGSYDDDVFRGTDNSPPPPRPPLPQSYPPYESDTPPPPPKTLPPEDDDEDFPPPPPTSLPPESDEKMDGTPEKVPQMSIVTTIY